MVGWIGGRTTESSLTISANQLPMFPMVMFEPARGWDGMGCSNYCWGLWRDCTGNRSNILNWWFFISVNLYRFGSKDYIIKYPNVI